jgi:acetolactate synthase regulatory subunit
MELAMTARASLGVAIHRSMTMAQKRNETANAIELLKQDHRAVEDLFKQFEKVQDNDPDAAAEIIESACTELQIHDKLETEIFYPAVREEAEKEEIEDLLDEAEVEHETVRELIEKIEAMEWEDEKLHAHFKVLSEYVKHHVNEEGQELFPKLDQLKNLDLESLGAEMMERKAELTSEMGIESGEETT